MEACVSPYNVLWSWTKTSQSRKTRHEGTISKAIGPHLPKQNENNNILRKQRHFILSATEQHTRYSKTFSKIKI